MSFIKSKAVNEKTVDVPFPEIEGFVVKIGYISRETASRIRKESTKIKTNAKTRQKEEYIDNDDFIERYAAACVKGWKGLKVKHLPLLFPADISDADPEQDVPYSKEEAVDLINSSVLFDSFLSDVQNDYEVFSETKRETITKN